MTISIYGFLFFFLFFSLSTQQHKNLLVIQMLNVGAHFPKEINGQWVTHLNDLTHIGMRQLYLLGREMANRFTLKGDFLREYNIPSEVIIKAAFANDNLTVASAYAYSRGLYPPGSGQGLSAVNIERAIAPFQGADFKKYQKELGDEALPHYYDTVPIMVEGGGPDYLLSAIKYCEGLRKLVSESESQGKRSELWDKGKTVIEELKNHFKTNIEKLEDTVKYRDYLESAKFFDVKEPISEDAIKYLKTVYDFIKFQEYFDDPLVAQIVSNGVLKEVKDALEQGIINPDKRKKLLTYVVEDQNVYALLKLINEKIEYSIPYASLLEINVTTDDENATSITAAFNGKALKWSDEKTVLSLEEFKDWIKDNTHSNEDFMSICLKGKDPEEEEDSSWLVIGICVILILLVVVILTLVYAIRKPNQAEAVTDAEAGLEF
jgi:hypothetical protein